jgi:hypothetical protein
LAETPQGPIGHLAETPQGPIGQLTFLVFCARIECYQC